MLIIIYLVVVLPGNGVTQHFLWLLLHVTVTLLLAILCGNVEKWIKKINKL